MADDNRETEMGNMLGSQYNILNDIQPALELSVDLQKCMLKLKASFMSADGGGVDYQTFVKSDLFALFQSKARELHRIDLQPLTSDQRKAFFINIYNALTIHALAVQPTLPSSVLDLQGFWKRSAYTIAGKEYSLDDIEHGILRKNKPHPSTGKCCFHGDDPRAAFVVERLDARIHFALNCGAQSCPPINVYTEQNLDRALDLASRNYLDQEVEANTETMQIQLPTLFKWYGSDAAQSDVEVARWTIPYLSEGKASRLEEVLAAWERGSKVNITYKPYSWKLNSINIQEETVVT